MPTLYVRNFPDHLHRKLRERATKSHRSISAEVVVLVDEALKEEEGREKQAETLRRLAENRRSYKPSPGAQDSLTMLREDRSR